MKIKAGFVTNSSSTSFLIYGINMENEKDFENLLARIKDKWTEYLTTNTETFVTRQNLEEYWHGDWGEFFLGVSPTECPDAMPMGDFKKIIEEFFAPLTDLNIDWRSEGWYDG